MTAPWSEQAKKRVTGWQHSEWRVLANSMGLGREPERTFEALSLASVPDDLITADPMRRDLGDNIVADAGWASAAVTMKEYQERYFIDPPTRYEIPISYSTLACELDVAVEALTAAHQTLLYPPLVASLLSGDVNAKIGKIPGSDEGVVLFQHGIVSRTVATLAGRESGSRVGCYRRRCRGSPTHG
jgi:hypothetical protein